MYRMIINLPDLNLIGNCEFNKKRELKIKIISKKLIK